MAALLRKVAIDENKKADASKQSIGQLKKNKVSDKSKTQVVERNF